MTTKKNSTTTKKEHYVSFDKDEMAVLRKLGWRERWLYMELKWKACFKSGLVGLGPYGRECLTAKKLSDLMVVPPSQGRESDVIDGTEVTRLLMRLNKAGLIGEIDRRENSGLIFALPLSPIDKVAARKARQVKVSQVMLPMPDTHQPLAEAHSDKAREDSSVSHSVMTPYGCINTSFISSDGAGDTPAPRRVVKVPTPIFSETPSPGALSIARIKERLDGSWFVYVDTPDSKRFYASWQKQGFTESEFEEAVDQVEQGDSLTPAAVDRVLRQRRTQRARPRPGRGRVAL